MNIKECLEEYGRPAALCSSDGKTEENLHAIISPLRYKNKMYLSGIYTEIGYNSEGHYLYIGPPDCDLTGRDGCYLLSEGIKYRIDRAEKVYFGKEVFYIWAIIRIIVEPD